MRFKNLPKTLIMRNLKAKAQDRNRAQVSKTKGKAPALHHQGGFPKFPPAKGN